MKKKKRRANKVLLKMQFISSPPVLSVFHAFDSFSCVSFNTWKFHESPVLTLFQIDGVFQANLGTIQNHLHSVTEGYIKNGDAKVELNDTEVVANNGNDVATSPYLNTSEGGVAIKGGKDKFSSSRGGIKEKKRKVRLLGKRSQEGIKIKQLTPETFEKEVEKQPANHKEIQKITDCLPQDSGEDKRGTFIYIEFL